MARLTLDLPDELRSRLQIRAAETGHTTIEAYVAELLRSDADAAATIDEDLGAPDHLTVRSAAELEAKLLEGEQSGPATEMTTDDWNAIGDEALARVAAERQRKRA